MINDKMELIKNFEKELKKILTDEKDFLTFLSDFGDNLQTNNQDITQLIDKRIKFINLISKYPKRKILFKYELDEKDYNGNKKTIKIGVNESGIGVINYGMNLENVEIGYFSKQLLKKLLFNDEFKEKLINNFSKKNKKELKNILKTIEKNDTDYNVDSEDIKIPNSEIIIHITKSEFEIYFKNTTYENQILSESKINRLKQGIKKRDKNEVFYEVSEYNLNLDFKEIMGLLKILPHKDKIKQLISKHIKDKKENSKKITKKLNDMNKLLMPYEVLEKI